MGVVIIELSNNLFKQRNEFSFVIDILSFRKVDILYFVPVGLFAIKISVIIPKGFPEKDEISNINILLRKDGFIQEYEQTKYKIFFHL